MEEIRFSKDLEFGATPIQSKWGDRVHQKDEERTWEKENKPQREIRFLELDEMTLVNIKDITIVTYDLNKLPPDWQRNKFQFKAVLEKAVINSFGLITGMRAYHAIMQIPKDFDPVFLRGGYGSKGKILRQLDELKHDHTVLDFIRKTAYKDEGDELLVVAKKY